MEDVRRWCNRGKATVKKSVKWHVHSMALCLPAIAALRAWLAQRGRQAAKTPFCRASGELEIENPDVKASAMFNCDHVPVVDIEVY